MRTCLILLSLIIFITACNQTSNKIKSIEIAIPEGPAPNAFLFYIDIIDKDLLEVLKECEGEFIFSAPLEELGSSSIRCYEISEQEVHIRVISTLWADLSDQELKAKEQQVNQEKTTLEIISPQSKRWKISN